MKNEKSNMSGSKLTGQEISAYFKKNPKKVIVADTNAPKKAKDLKKDKIIAAGGEPLWLTGDPKRQKGHGTTIADPDITIKPSNLFVTPEKINVAMAPKKIKNVKEIKTPYTDLDFKIEGDNIRFGLLSIKGISDKSVEKLYFLFSMFGNIRV